MDESAELLPCARCGRMGWTDQRQWTEDGHICVRCARPDIDWDKIDNIKVVKS